MQPQYNQYTSKIQSKYNQNSTRIQPQYNQNTTEIQPKYNKDAIKIQLEYNQNTNMCSDFFYTPISNFIQTNKYIGLIFVKF